MPRARSTSPEASRARLESISAASAAEADSAAERRFSMSGVCAASSARASASRIASLSAASRPDRTSSARAMQPRSSAPKSSTASPTQVSMHSDPEWRPSGSNPASSEPSQQSHTPSPTREAAERRVWARARARLVGAVDAIAVVVVDVRCRQAAAAVALKAGGRHRDGRSEE
eukprot:scaffold16556_cov133-Isochrysis_galbana.AAC.3